MSKYTPLKEYLLNLPRDRETLSLTFDQVDKVLGARLPKSAKTYLEWWSNQEYGVQAPSWQDAGFFVDGVDLGRQVVYFRRKGSVKPRESKEMPDPDRHEPVPERILLDAGFVRTAQWTITGDDLDLLGNIPTDPGVYAHVVDGQIMYIGSALMGLKKRLRFYARPGKTQRTSQRINSEIMNCLRSKQKAWVLTALPPPTVWKGLPVDRITGLETGLLKSLRPIWNKRGV